MSNNVTQLIIRVFCPVSIATNCALIFCVRTIKRLQGNNINHFQEFLAVSDIITSIIFTVGSDISVTNPDLCTALGAIMQYSLLSTSTWSFLVSLLCYVTIAYSDDQANKLKLFFYLYGWGIPLVSVCGLFSLQAAWQRGTIFGDATFECWISPAYLDLRVDMFYIPLWIQFAMTTTTYGLTVTHIHKILIQYAQVAKLSVTSRIAGAENYAERSVRRSNHKLFVKSGMLIFGFFVTWLPSTIVRVLDMAGQPVPSWLMLIVSISFALSGFWNSGSSSQPQLQTAAPPAKKTISRDEWEAKLAEVKINKRYDQTHLLSLLHASPSLSEAIPSRKNTNNTSSDLNKLVMNYLVIEGYKDAVEKFSQESGIAPNVNLEGIEERLLIRTAVQEGRIDEAISRVNDLDPEILDTNPALCFHLQQQKLIELIRAGNISAALDFAQEELAPEFLEELEQTMSLLAFDISALQQQKTNPASGPAASPVASLLEYSQRLKVAGELNAAILKSQSQERTPKLPMLLKMLVWAQNQLEERVSFPQIKNLLTAELVEESSQALPTLS
ncbi:hypothetical protein HDU84_006763 [Entophlyctis sp. JEL0112]|nr:hypothetical protein HDU84_006763 [Entophlyctis sp. JEL0112]